MPDRSLALTAPARSIEIAAPPSLPSQFLRALWHARSRPEGALAPARAQALGPVEAAWRGISPDRRRVERYRAACQQRDDGALPASWLETLFLGPMAAIVLSEAFPFSPLGLIHLRQRIAPRRAIRPDERLDAVCRLAAVRETARGFEIDFAMEVRSRGDVPWTGLATVLSRNAGTRRRTRDDAERVAEIDADGWDTEPVDAPADIGRRYAAASGDWNPHHLWPLSARLVGYRRPIAHGMWTLGRALARLEERLAPPWSVEAAFKRPLYLPGRVALRWRDEGDGTRFEVRHATKGELHLAGQLRPG